MSMGKPQQKHVVIIGAGPAGLAAAAHALELGHRVTVLEKSDIPGGKGCSRPWGQYIVDCGPHAFHAMSREITDFMRRHGGEQFVQVKILQRLYVTEEAMQYPLAMKEAFVKFDPGLKLKICVDYLGARIKYWIRRPSLDSFKSWGMANYGHTLYKICFGDYSMRVWGIDPAQLSVEFAKRKLPALSLSGILWQLITGQSKGKKDDKSYLNVRHFYYHLQGIGQVYDRIAQSIQQQGCEIIYNARIDHIQWEGNRIKSLELHGHRRIIPCDSLVSTTGMDDLIGYLKPQDDQLKGLAAALPYKHGVIVNVALKRPRLSDAHWIYLVNKRFVFNRLSEPKNLSPYLAPADRTLIMLETICGSEDPRWQWEAGQWRGHVMKDLSFFGVSEDEIEDIFLTKMEKSYPLYLVGYEQRKKALLERLALIPNLISTGRYGLYMDIDMHDAMVLGKTAVDYVLQESPGEFYREHEGICFKHRD